MRKVLGMMRVGHIEDGCPVCFLCTAQRVQTFGYSIGPTMVADIGDPAPGLFVDHRLIGATCLQVVVADQRHILGLRGVLRESRSGHEPEYERPARAGNTVQSVASF